MEASMRKCFLLSIFTVAASAMPFSAADVSSTCLRGFRTFIHDLNSQCPLSIPFNSSPILVDVETFEETLNTAKKNEYIAILFYASWCPFSFALKSQFSILSSLYPEISHLMLEQSSVMPSVFSRYGIHSFPSLVIVHQTTPTRFHGQRDLKSLVDFYKRTTGLKPIVNMVEEKPSDSNTSLNIVTWWNGATLREIFLGEPYLFVSVVFVLFRACVYLFPRIASCIAALWTKYILHPNLGVVGDSRQLLGRVLHLINVKRSWSKLRQCKNRNFHKGTRNARVWASSLASVSLGDTSPSRVPLSSNL